MFLGYGIWQALSLNVTQHTPDVRLVLLAETEMSIARSLCVSKSLTANEVLPRPHNWGTRFLPTSHVAPGICVRADPSHSLWNIRLPTQPISPKDESGDVEYRK
jgi:hypothetical protein